MPEIFRHAVDSYFFGSPALALLAYHAAASALAFVVYWQDKRAARQGQWRTSERSLHLLGLAGGWPGALAAQRRLRHKTSKRSFQVVFWITVVAHLGLLAFVVSNA